jgi:hypothetical protein
MSACAHRPEDGCAFVPCASVGGCVCAVEVKQDEKAAQDALAQDALGEIQ